MLLNLVYSKKELLIPLMEKCINILLQIRFLFKFIFNYYFIIKRIKFSLSRLEAHEKIRYILLKPLFTKFPGNIHVY